ncbi:uncharacterized protein LOC143044811 isoform X1 [Mytilus galloprovincialis]|uniref:uncharacterized protein LOC143044811 isoform X1 n=2 Tax=Mytilus galloprovincialis TaxID=29158 RepID=UPI003F7CAB4F
MRNRIKTITLTLALLVTLPLFCNYSPIIFDYYIHTGRMYAYSAIGKLNGNWTKHDSIVITGWCRGYDIFNCILFTSDQQHARVKAKRWRQYSNGWPKMYACQFICKITKKNITHISIVKDGAPYNSTLQVLKVTYPTRQQDKLAVCSKMAYGTEKPIKLIEWFEYNLLMGVDKFITLVQPLNRDAFKVLKYYQQKGVLEMGIFPAPLPGEATADNLDCKIKDRKECFTNYSYDEMKDIPWTVFRRPSPQGFHDQQVALYHCIETLQGYDFVANVDFDEFIVHSQFKQFKDYLKNNLMPRYPTAAGFTLNHSYFITDWGVSGDGFLQMSRFVKRLDPRLLNYKNIVIPSRIDDITTHNLEEKLGYRRVYLKSHDMVVHHYRTCPTVGYWKDCLNFPKYKDSKMNSIRPEMEARVLRVLKKLGLK